MKRMNNLINLLKNKKGKLMVVFPHPDDETVATGGLLLSAKENGWSTVVVTLTKGDAGQCYIDKNGLELSEIREKELKKATDILKADRLIAASFPDAKLRENELKVEKYLVSLLHKERPNTVVTYDHSGFTGHPDHISLSTVLLKIISKLKLNTDLYWVSAPSFLAKLVINNKTVKYSMPPTHYLSIGVNIFAKLRACLAHKSQDVGGRNVLLYLYLVIFNREWYYKVDLTKKYKHEFVYFKI